MNSYAILGILSLAYSVLVVLLTLKKPEKIWKMKKIQWFEKVLGVKGTEMFFYVWAALFLGLSIWLINHK